MGYRRSVGHYLLYNEIASGGMGTVFLGQLRSSGGFSRVVAIKQLNPLLAKEAEFRAMFLDEARLAGRIRHPNVASTIDVVEEEHDVFLIMEYVHGESLSQLIRLHTASGGRIPPRIVSAILTGVLYGLHAAHEATDEQGRPLDLVHRDVSPQNVIVGSDGVARVVDFGVARAIGRLHTTGNGELKGKIAYMPPEQLRARPLDRRADVYAAGVVLWEALTATRLFRGDNDPETMTKVLLGQVPPARSIAPESPASLDDVILRALAQDPQARFGTAREMSVALLEACPPAAPHEVGEWVDGCAHESLAKKSARIAELESGRHEPVVPRERTLHGVAPAPQQDVTEPTETFRALGAKRTRSIASLGAGCALIVAVALFASNANRWRAEASPPPLRPLATADQAALPPAQGEGGRGGDVVEAQSSAAAAPVTAPPAVTTPPPRPQLPVRPRLTRAPRAANCTPPFDLDAAGHKHWKLECLENAP